MSATVFTYGDALRLVGLGLAMSAIASFPSAVYRQGRHWSAWFAVIGCELFMFSALIEVADHFGTPIVWYRTPLIILAASLILIFVVYSYSHNHRRGGK